MPTPTGGPRPDLPPDPISPKKNSKPLKASGSSPNAQDAFLLQSPFAKMFSSSGATPTLKDMKMIIDNILQGVISNMKQQEAQEKEAAARLRKVIEGEDD